MYRVHAYQRVLIGLTMMVAALLGLVASAPAQAQEKKPNILVIFGDDV
jgi:hypothetical protein